MLHITLLSHAETIAQRRGIFPGNEALDGDIAISDMSKLEHLKSVVCAPCLAATATAEQLQYPYTIDRDLPIYFFGRWAGRSLKDIAKEEPLALQAWLQDPYVSPHGGSSYAQIYDKCVEWIENLNDSSNLVLYLTDAIIIRCVLVHVLSAPLASLFRMDIAPLARIEVIRQNQSWKLQAASFDLSI